MRLSRRELELVGLVPRDLARMAHSVKTCGDLPQGAVDASMIIVTARLGISRVALSIADTSRWRGRSTCRR